MDILKKHYEKIILGCLLLSFVIALIYLLQIMSATHDTGSSNSTIAKNTLVIQRANQKYNFGYTAENFSFEKSSTDWDERSGEGLIGYGRPGLAVPMKALRCSQCHKILPWAQLRKNDLRCPFEACSQDLSDPGEPVDYEKELANFDSDGDGMPDRYEIRMGLNPQSADDADQDKDGDRFSNWFEYYCNTNPDNSKSFPALDKMIFLSKLEAAKLPIRLNGITAVNPADKSKFRIHLTIDNRDSNMSIGTKFTLSGKRYEIVDAEKRNKTEQGTSNSLQVDDSTIWIMPVDSKNKADRLELRARKEVFDHKTHKADIRDVRSPTKRKKSMRSLTTGSTFKIKSSDNDKDALTFKLVKASDKSVEVEYVVDNHTKKLSLELVDRKSVLYERIKKAYIKEDANKNNQQPVEEPKQVRRSSRRR